MRFSSHSLGSSPAESMPSPEGLTHFVPRARGCWPTDAPGERHELDRRVAWLYELGVAYRPELNGQRPRVRALTLTGVLGGACGAEFCSPRLGAAFDAIVPFLVFFGSLLLLAQPRIAAYVNAHVGSGRRHTIQLPRPCSFAAMYGAYFGGGWG